MKKHLLKFKSWLLLLCMIVGATSSALADEYELITSTSDLVAGDQYLFVCEADNAAMGAIGGSSTSIGASVSTTISTNTITATSDMNVITLGGETGEWTFYTSKESKYLSWTSGNSLAVNGTVNGNAQKWTISFSGNNAVIANKGTTARKIQYNKNSPRFACYTTTQTAIQIYKKKAVVTVDPTITFNNGSVRVGQNLDLSTLFTSNSEGEVTYSITDGDSYATIAGSTLTGKAEGSVTVKAEQAAAGNYNAGEASATITVNAALALSSIAITTAPTKTTYTEGETFDPTGMVVTATYSDSSTGNVTASCTFSPSTALTTSDTEITVTYGDKTTTYDITVNAISKYYVTWSVNGVANVDPNGYIEGAAIEFPDDPDDVNGKTFVGWVAEAIDGTTDNAPDFVSSANMGKSDITYYAVFAYVDGESNDESMTLTASTENIPGSYGSANTFTEYELEGVNFQIQQMYKNGGKLQWRAAGNSNGTGTMYNSESLDKIESIVLTYNSSDANKNFTLKIGDSANPTDGESITPSISGSVYTFDCSSYDYGYFVLANGSSAGYLDDITINYTVGSSTITDYCTTVAAVAVARPTITVAENPFLFSTTATITCETEGAAIKYSYDEETWNDYSSALTITETKTIYAKAVKDANESTVASVTATKNLATPIVTVSGDLTVDLNGETDVEAGTLTAAVTYNEAPVEGAAVTWSSSNVDVATIDENTGVVTIKTRGTVTFTATYASNGDYAEATDTKQIIVTDSKAPGSAGNPYTVAEAKAAIDASEGTTDVYVAGIVSQVDSYNSTYKSITYWISDDGTTTNQFEVYSGKGIGGADFSSVADIQVGDVVVVNGDIKLYHTTYEFDKNNQLVSLVRKVATPTFDPAAGEVIAGSTVTISTTTEDATIYYTTNGDEPTTESTSYTGPITIDADKTIKAIAVKDGMTNSDVASARYTIIVTPTIAISTNLIEATAAGADDIVALAYSNLTIGDESDFAVQYCDNLGEEIDAPNWMEAEVSTEDGENYSVSYTIGENTSTEPRTAYFKVYAMDDETNLVYSDLVTVTQAGMVIDYVTLPFEYNGGRDDIPTGLTQSGLGTDYNSSTAPNTQLKFDGSSDELTLKINEAATILSFNIKGNSFSGGTFKVQTSVDGEDYNDLETYKELSESQETFVLGANIRYIKWIYTKKQSGNVGLGNIKVEKRMGDATVTLASACNDGEGNYYGTYSNTTGFVVPEGLTVAEVGINAENKLIVEEYATGAIVPANTGVMVSSTTDGAHDIVLSTGGTSVLGEDNRLRASGAGITAEAMAAADSECLFYRLTMHNGTDIGFWWGAAEGAAFNLAANKAYLAVSNAVSVKGFSLFSDDETGITEVAEKTEGTEKVFDLSGRRVVKPTKGLYIVNGKKYIKK